ncbi:MAG: HD domain-containing protein [Candidatus Magasanikbacteria bacterium]|uniref:HD domain-containing protein n=1 Tax=Candidatus Magasanikbacteria bacterium CG10_big_fil_rev_8_21_14_0_10_38_6 TaxID=1974647 RepID=A0A2M6P1R1_9BACT|nr:HD domain-containing protein [Candidatus Magasanikbacteria bacterium]NCS72327.1 HD domain-containing protein [Candidatus Magasanikbacteria bacterium]PIR77360.1 MAG: hypothetical protein COU30_02900 [Candidatus Magasanikbacteria bacterium CG10_big_fil_rev_8_21_14_0_10_38_6]
MYTKSQQQLMTAVKKIVADFFEEYPVTAHGFDHVARVARRAKEIAVEENARNVFLCELAGWLHDIGRVPEHTTNTNKRHHELSYELLKQWYTTYEEFTILTQEEKIELLYAVRYHWNNAACAYDTAWILRDADKLDMFGDIGLHRAQTFFKDNKEGLSQDMRNHFDAIYWIKTKTAKKIMKTEHLLEPIEAAYKNMLQSKIEEISLN